jgi:hypothetical protein
LKNQREILQKANKYKEQLAIAIQEKDLYDNTLSPDIDLIIFSLVDKLEILFWVLDIEIADDDMLDRLDFMNH